MLHWTQKINNGKSGPKKGYTQELKRKEGNKNIFSLGMIVLLYSLYWTIWYQTGESIKNKSKLRQNED